MTEIGKYNTLEVVKKLDFGVYLNGHELGEILLPIKQVPDNTEIGDEIEVFLYADSEDRLIATSMRPFAQVGEFALLRCVAVEKVGAFLDWGLVKNVLVPFSEQNKAMEQGRSYLVYIYLDKETNRIAASARHNKFLSEEPPLYEENQKVKIIIKQKTDLGYTAIIENKHVGLIYENEIFKDLNIGQRMYAYIKKKREDNKIDLSLHPLGYQKIDEMAFDLLKKIRESNNFIPFTDKSDADIIYQHFGISKKNFKKAVGSLYKNKLIRLDENGISYITD